VIRSEFGGTGRALRKELCVEAYCKIHCQQMRDSSRTPVPCSQYGRGYRTGCTFVPTVIQGLYGKKHEQLSESAVYGDYDRAGRPLSYVLEKWCGVGMSISRYGDNRCSDRSKVGW